MNHSLDIDFFKVLIHGSRNQQFALHRHRFPLLVTRRPDTDHPSCAKIIKKNLLMLLKFYQPTIQ